MKYTNNTLKRKIDSKLGTARKQAMGVFREAQEKSKQLLVETKKYLDRKEGEIEEERQRLAEKDIYLDQRQEFFYKKEKELDEFKKNINQSEIILFEKQKQLHNDIYQITGMGKEEVLDLLFKRVEKEHKEDLFNRIKKLSQGRDNEI